MSGDKLLGGPQAGLIVGDAKWIDAMRRNPLARAYRVDKLTLAALEATLALYREPARALAEIPTLALLGTSTDELRSRAGALQRALSQHDVACDVVDTAGSVGAGAFPDAELAGPPAVVGRVHDGRLHLDLRAVLPRELPDLARAVVDARE